jgi:hypothetical protein
MIFAGLLLAVLFSGMGWCADAGQNDQALPDLTSLKPPDMSDVPGYDEYIRLKEQAGKELLEAMKTLEEQSKSRQNNSNATGPVQPDSKQSGSPKGLQSNLTEDVRRNKYRLLPARPLSPPSAKSGQSGGVQKSQAESETLLLLKPGEIEEIKKKALEYRKVMETEPIPSGIIRDLFVDDRHVYEIRTQVNYSTVIRFPEGTKISLSDVVGNTDRFVIDEYDKGNALLIFPVAPFKATNMTVFAGKKAYHFLLIEEMDRRHCDFRVDVHYATENMLTVTEILRMLIKEHIPDTPEVRYAGARMLSPLCRADNDTCRMVVAILDIERPDMRAYKFRDEEKRIKPFGAMYQTRHNGFLYAIYNGSRGRVVVNGEIMDIER